MFSSSKSTGCLKFRWLWNLHHKLDSRFLLVLGAPGTRCYSANSSTFLALGNLCLLSLCVSLSLLKGTHCSSFPSNILSRSHFWKKRAGSGSWLWAREWPRLSFLSRLEKTQVRTRSSYLPSGSTECNVFSVFWDRHSVLSKLCCCC